MNNRYLGALTLIPILLLIFLGGNYLKIVTFVLSLRALYEFYFILKKKGHNPSYVLGYGTLISYYVLIFFDLDPIYNLSVIIILSLFINFIVMIFKDNMTIVDVSLGLTGFLYSGVFFSFLPLMDLKENGIYFVYLVFIISWFTDTLAYYTGRFFGKHKLIEKVSPKKTIEGAVGGVLGGALGSLLLGFIIKDIVLISLVEFFTLGAIASIFGQIGDLTASSIKRYTKEKDYPKLIPGHGGILDRFDSTLFVSVIVYIYLYYLI